MPRVMVVQVKTKAGAKSMAKRMRKGGYKAKIAHTYLVRRSGRPKKKPK